MFSSDKLLITEGDYVILQRGCINQMFQINERKPVYFCKQKLSLSQIIGKPYGSLFELKGKSLVPAQEAPEDLQIQVETSAKDNRCLIDDGTSQQLTKDEIETLKSEGVSTENIVKTLVENSLTFNNKTQYSQEKYVKKKKDKYGNYIRVSKTNIRLLSELYHRHGPPKICNLRVDTISQMLSAANVMSGGKYLVVDSCLGLLVSAVLEKSMPEGKVIQIYMEPGPVSSYRQAVDAMNYKKEDLNTSLYGISYHNLNLEKQNEKLDAEVTTEGEVLQTSDDVQQEEPVESMELDHSIDNEVKGNGFLEKKRAKQDRKALRKKETEEALKLLTPSTLDGLLVCCRCAPGPLALSLLNYLAPSRPFALHSMMLQPLVEAYDQIKSSNKAVFLKLTETWLRKYQVLPERTHPEINMSNTGGYLLTGIKVEPVSR